MGAERSFRPGSHAFLRQFLNTLPYACRSVLATCADPACCCCVTTLLAQVRRKAKSDLIELENELMGIILTMEASCGTPAPECQ